jgi:hypothetical protein
MFPNIKGEEEKICFEWQQVFFNLLAPELFF